MLIPRVMPCLLKRGNALVKTIKFKNPNYIGDPVNTAQIFNNFEVDELVFLDISVTIEKKPPAFNIISKIAQECFMPLTYGGGVRNIEGMKKIFSLGIEKIVICSYAAENPYFIREATEIFGSQSIVVAIDVRKKSSGRYETYIHSGEIPTGVEAVNFAIEMEKMGAGEIFLNSIDKDGTMQGYDFELIKLVSRSVNIPLVACGGAGRLEDFKEAVEAGASAVAAGSFFVYQNENRSVLVNFPEREELINIFKA